MKKAVSYVLLLTFLGIFINSQFFALNNGRRLIALAKDAYTSEDFRQMYISKKNYAYLKTLAGDDTEKFCSYLTSLMLVYDFDLVNHSALNFSKRKLDNLVKKQRSLKEDAYEKIVSSYQAVFADMEVFPVATSQDDENATCSYVDSWGFPRSYGGKRTHEGCDLMADINERNLYPIISATDGKVEKIGWLEKGGYRIGIRSPNGGYYYYAHLASYAKEFTIGEEVKAGTLLGYMGDTGYGTEGTTGQFPVHLHFGIYFNDEDGNEISVNPYYLLKIWENSTVVTRFHRDSIE